MARTSRISRISRQSTSHQPVPTLEHDAIAIALQEALGTRVLLIRSIGEGGMGRVYLGRDPQLKRFVAVKVLVQAGADSEAHARFQREAQAIAAVSHPNVVSIYGVGELPDGTPYFVMQYVSGGSMSERLAASGPLPIEMAEGVLGDVAAALAAAHKRGIIHRDVKPANVLWDEESERATVSDFGIASLMSDADDENAIRITQGGMRLGSPAYMSPEQLLAEPITPKSDIYALGLLGYELLTGRGPYTAETPAAVAAAHIRDEPRPLAEVRPDAPPVLGALLKRCLSKDASERPTADELTAALTPGAPDVLEWPPPGLERTRGALWRLMSMPALGSVCLLLPLLLMLQLTNTAQFEDSIVWTIALAASAIVGLLAFSGAAYRMARAARATDAAARLRYGWATLMEVAVDRKGDTGALIAGVREYAVLTAGERSALRILRIIRAVLMFMTAPVALIVAFIVLSMHGGEPDGAHAFVVAVAWAVVVLGGAGIVASVPESWALASIRKRRGVHSSRKSDAELAPAWYAAFERSREGQALGSGSPVRRAVIVLIGTTATIVVLFCAAVLLSITLVTFSGRLANRVYTPSLSSWLTFASQRNPAVRSFRTAPDSATSAIAAGDAMLAITSTAHRRSASPIERPLKREYPLWSRVVPPSSMFEKQPGAAWTDAAILAAASGLTAEQRALLISAAAHPAQEEFTRVAHAARMDVYGALLRLPLSNPLFPSEYPTESLAGLDEAMESRAARVALDVADHRFADADHDARDMIAVASQVMDMPFSFNVFRGYRALQRGVRTLESVYIATGRERDARMLMDSVAAGSERVNRYPASLTSTNLHSMMRTDFARGIRMEVVLPVLARACANPRQLLFGPDEATKSEIEYVRDSLAVHPSEKLWIESLSQMIHGNIEAPADLRRNLPPLMIIPAMVDGIVGGHRFVNCMLYSPLVARF